MQDVQVQLDFLIELKYLLNQAKQGKHELICFDPCHQLHNTINGKCWQEKGKEGTIALPSNTGRKRVNILGALNLCSTKFSGFITEENCDYTTVKQTLVEIRNDYRNGKKIILILDNAKYNHSVEVKDLAAKLGIELKYLPAYCPNLNLIERLWKFLKRLLKNKYVPTLKEFFVKIVETCRNFNGKYNEEIKELIGQKIQIIK